MGFIVLYKCTWKRRIRVVSMRKSIWISDPYVPLLFSNPNNQGVLLGTGTSSLMLSLLPGKVLKVSTRFDSSDGRSQKYSATQEIEKSPLNPSWPLGDGITEPRNLISTRRMRV